MYVIYCIDRPNSEAVRARVRSDHLAYLKKFDDRIVAAGPILGDEGQPTGSVLIVDFPDRAGVDEFLVDEPYSRNRLFEMSIVRPWKGVMGKWVPSSGAA